MKMKPLLKMMNIFSFEIDFNYRNERYFHSIFGYFLSLMLYSVLIIFFYFFSKDFFEKSNPIVMLKETKFDNYNLDFKDFFKKFSLSFNYDDTIGYLDQFYQNKDINLINQNPIFNLALIIRDEKNDFIQIYLLNQTLNVSKNYDGSFFCQSYYVHNENNSMLVLRQISPAEDFFLLGNISNYISENLKEPKLQLNPDSQIYLTLIPNQSFLKIIYEGNFNFTNINLGYTIIDSFIDSENIKFFETFDISQDIFEIKFTKKSKYKFGFEFQRFRYTFQLIELLDDLGFIFSEKNPKTKLKKVSEMTTSETDLLYIFEIKFDRVKKIYERRFKKLQSVIADLGGLINSFIIIGNIMIYIFNENKFYYELINQLFKFESFDIIKENERKFPNKKIENKKFLDNLNKNKKINQYNNSSSQSVRSLNHSEIILKSLENPSKINLEKIHQQFDYYSNKDINRIKNEKILEISDNSITKKKNHKSKIELPIYDEKKICKVDINKIELVDDESIMKNKIHQFIQIKNKKSRIIKFTRYEFLKMILCFKNFKNSEFIKKEEIFKSLTNKIKNYLNVINYCSLFENFEKLKLILLNPIQNFSFNFLKSPKFSKSENNNLEIEMRNVYKYFINNKDGLKDIDNRLIDNFSLDLMSFLN